MSKKEDTARRIKEEKTDHRRNMVKGVEDFYNSVPEERRNPNHKEDFEELLGLMVNDRSEKKEEKIKYITPENLLLIGFEKVESDLGTMFVRKDIKIIPDDIYKAYKADFGTYKIEYFKQKIVGLEIEIRKLLQK